jgi:hypothetical protein
MLIMLWGRLWAQALIFPLPQDEKEASPMISEGVLDSITWQMVRPYYEHPLFVPMGELRILIDLFPNRFPSLPTSSRDLSNYEPWKEPDVQRFFHDFPGLEIFSPILSFETVPGPYHARTGCTFYKYKKSDPAIAVDFTTSPEAAVGMEGRIGFDATSARWQRRSASLGTARLGKVALGNFHLNMDQGLFYGYFPTSSSDRDARLNWRYAESNTWNGTLYEGPESGHGRVALFYHQRKTETIYGARFGVRSLGNFYLFAGASKLILPTVGRNNFSFAHTEVGFSDDRWNIGISGGCEQSNVKAIPFIAYVRHTKNNPEPASNAGFDVMYANMPAGCPVMRSPLFHESVGKTDKADSARIDRSVVKTECRIPLNAWIKSACGMSYYHSLGHSSAEGFVSFSGTAWLSYSLRYSFRPVIDNSPQYHFATVSLARAVARSLEMRACCRYVNKDESHQSVFFRLTAATTALPSMDIAPFAAVYTATPGDREFSLGLAQALRLFEKTWGELKMEVPVVKNFQDQWILSAQAHFYL